MELGCLLDKVRNKKKLWNKTTTKTQENDPLISCAHPFGYTNTGEKKQMEEKGVARCHVTTPLHLQTPPPDLETSRDLFFRLLFCSDFSLRWCCFSPPILPPLFPLILLLLLLLFLDVTPPWSCGLGRC